MTDVMANVEVTLSALRGMGETDLGSSEPLLIDQDRINGFADATDDHQWIHVDPDRAAAGPFGATIAHGYLTLSLVPRLLTDLLLVTDQVRGANYGIDRARFPSVVPVGARVRMTGRLLAVTDRDDGGVRYKVGVDVRVVGSDRPSLVAELLFLAYDS